MYNRMENQEILTMLRRIEEKLDDMKEVPKTTKSIMVDSSSDLPEKRGTVGEDTVWNLTQMQYELSNELFNGIHALKQVIHAGEKHTCQAKGKYQK